MLRNFACDDDRLRTRRSATPHATMADAAREDSDAPCADRVRPAEEPSTPNPQLTSNPLLYIDFHTHRVPSEADVLAVVDGRDTWGLHPWQADQPFQVPDLAGRLAIGECGLDALRGPEMPLQQEVFLRHVGLSERLAKPLVVHCVRALDLLLALHCSLRPKQPWMLHGFRGKPQQLRSLLNAGFYVSFGHLHNPDSLRLCPLHRLMLETDNDDGHAIREIYNNVAQELRLPTDKIALQLAKNYTTFFRKQPLPM